MPAVLKVSQLNRYVKFQLEADMRLREVYVAGEIGTLTVNQRSGHIYFSLRDQESSVRAVMFAKNAEYLRFMPQVGMAVVARGSATLYERDGSFQLNVVELMPDGASALGFAYEKQKKLLAEKGYFDQSKKRPLPTNPSVIGVVTSESGAVLHDIISTIERRNPSVKLIFAAASVQGREASYSIAEAVRMLNDDGRSEAIIVARGGGSAEDLWCFNEEAAVKAVSESQIPVISAVGHETDVTLCDLAADVRAATPTAAAEIAVLDRSMLFAKLEAAGLKMTECINDIIMQKQRALETVKSSKQLSDPEFFIHKNRQRLNNLVSLLYNHSQQTINMNQGEISVRAAVLESLSPLKVLARGYSIALVDGKTVVSSKQLKIGDDIDISFCDGSAKAAVTAIEKD